MISTVTYNIKMNQNIHQYVIVHLRSLSYAGIYSQLVAVSNK